MKLWLKILVVLGGLLLSMVLIVFLLTPWMDSWGAEEDEISATFPGDELIPNPASYINRAVSINAPPELIYPWLVQIDARKAGWYSYTWLERLINCPMENADRIHPEWQNIEVGDLVHMCPGEPAPPPYIVAQLHPDHAFVIGHQDEDKWVDLYQFVILPQEDGTSRLVLRTRSNMVGGIWTIIKPGAFIMERGMLLGIKERAENLALMEGYIENPLLP